MMMTMPMKYSLAGLISFLVMSGSFAYAASSSSVSSAALHRFSSPSGHYDIVFEPLSNDWTHVQKAEKGVVRETLEQYAIEFYPAQSNALVNAIYFADEGKARSPDELLHLMSWSPNEKYVVIPDKINAREGNHVFQLVAPLDRNHVWRLQCDNVHWVDENRLVGDINTKEMPGGLLEFNGAEGKATLLIEPNGEFGYQIDAVAGTHVIVKEFLNGVKNAKATWELFTPACIDLDLDTLKKKSVECSK